MPPSSVCTRLLSRLKTGVKEAFYRDLHNLLQQVDSKDKLLVLGDFNTRAGLDFVLWKRVLGKHGDTYDPNTGTSWTTP